MATQQKVDELENEIQTLKKELADVTGLLKDIGESEAQRLSRKTHRAIDEATDKAERIWRDIENEGEDIYYLLKDKFQMASSRVERSAKDNPLATVGLIAGVSLMVGYLFNNKH